MVTGREHLFLVEITQPCVSGNSIQQSGKDDLRSQPCFSGQVKSGSALGTGMTNQGLSQMHMHTCPHMHRYLSSIPVHCLFNQEKKKKDSPWFAEHTHIRIYSPNLTTQTSQIHTPHTLKYTVHRHTLFHTQHRCQGEATCIRKQLSHMPPNTQHTHTHSVFIQQSFQQVPRVPQLSQKLSPTPL